jgi:hypothetical protein
MGGLFGGGGGGSAPKAPKLRQVSTSLTGPLYTKTAAIGDKWAELMRASYGLGPPSEGAPASWEAQYLGPGALAMQSQAAQQQVAPGQDPQVQQALATSFGPGGGTFGGAGAGSSWDLGADPYAVSRNLGQNPLQQLSRGQQFTQQLLKQWQPPNLRLTGEDLLNVSMGQAAQNAQAQQAAFQASLTGQLGASQAQSALSAAGIGALGKLGAAGITQLTQPSPSLSPTGYYQPSFLGAMFGQVPSYGAGSYGSEALGPGLEATAGGMDTGGGGGLFSGAGS